MSSSYFVYFLAIIVIIGIIFVVRSNKKSREAGPVMTGKVKGKGKKPKNSVMRSDAKVVSIDTQKKSGELQTVVTFDDGYTFTTRFAKSMRTVGIGSARTSYVVDQEVREVILKEAIEKHNLDC